MSFGDILEIEQKIVELSDGWDAMPKTKSEWMERLMPREIREGEQDEK